MTREIERPFEQVLIVGDVAWSGKRTPTVEGLPRAGVGLVANLEGPISDRPTPRELRKTRWCGVYNTPEVIDWIRALGTVGVTVANNHIHDFEEGLARTMDRLRSDGVRVIGVRGVGSEPAEVAQRLGVGEKTICLFSAMDPAIGGVFGRPGKRIWSLEDEDLYRSISAAKENHIGKVVVLPHWGYELCEMASPMQRWYARRLVAAGADLIVGHHPHVLQGTEVVGTTPVVYSVGNFAFYQGKYVGVSVAYPENSLVGRGVIYDGDTVNVLVTRQTKNDHVNIDWATLAPVEGNIERPFETAPEVKEYVEHFKKEARYAALNPVVSPMETRRSRAWKALLRESAWTLKTVLRKARVRRGWVHVSRTRRMQENAEWKKYNR